MDVTSHLSGWPSLPMIGTSLTSGMLPETKYGPFFVTTTLGSLLMETFFAAFGIPEAHDGWMMNFPAEAGLALGIRNRLGPCTYLVPVSEVDFLWHLAVRCLLLYYALY